MPLYLVPLEEDNPCRNRPYAVWLLIAVNVVAFVASVALDADEIVTQYAYRPSAPSFETLFTSMFVHAGVIHLLANMLFLYMFGDNVEDVTGHLKFIVAYLLCGIAGTWLAAILTHHPQVPMVGASGAVSGVMGMYAVLQPRAQFETHVVLLRWSLGGFKSSALMATGAWFGQQLLFALLSSWFREPIFGIAFWAHVGGFGAGLLLAFLLGRILFGYAADEDMRIAGRRWTSFEP